MDIPSVFNLHSQLADKAIHNCSQLQAEINSDEGSIFQNKKYKELLKLAAIQQTSLCSQIDNTYQMDTIGNSLISFSKLRNPEAAETTNVFEAYISELIHTYNANKKVEDALREAAEKAAKEEAEAAAKALEEAKGEEQKEGDKKKQAKKKKGKELPT